MEVHISNVMPHADAVREAVAKGQAVSGWELASLRAQSRTLRNGLQILIDEDICSFM